MAGQKEYFEADKNENKQRNVEKKCRIGKITGRKLDKNSFYSRKKKMIGVNNILAAIFICRKEAKKSMHGSCENLIRFLQKPSLLLQQTLLGFKTKAILKEMALL